MTAGRVESLVARAWETAVHPYNRERPGARDALLAEARAIDAVSEGVVRFGSYLDALEVVRGIAALAHCAGRMGT